MRNVLVRRSTVSRGLVHNLDRSHLRISNVACSAVAPIRPDDLRFVSQADLSTRHDLILSSGFLAFANHAGFLQAVEERGISVGGVMGTSAGALAGSLYCAGYSPQQVVQELCRVPPIQLLRPALPPWNGGVLSLEGVVERLRMLLPARFDDLPREFACGVVGPDGKYCLVDRGNLPEAVAASAAVPFLFSGVEVPGLRGRCKDGGCSDRVGLKAWRARRRAQLLADGRADARVPHALVHVITRSSPFSGADDVPAMGEDGWTVVNSPRSGRSLFDLGDWEMQMEAAYLRAMAALALRPGGGCAPAGAAAAGLPAVRSAGAAAARVVTKR